MAKMVDYYTGKPILEGTFSPPGEMELARKLALALADEVTHHGPENCADASLQILVLAIHQLGLLDKYREIEKQNGKRVELGDDIKAFQEAAVKHLAGGEALLSAPEHAGPTPPKVTELELAQIEMAAQRELSWLECANDPYSLAWILSDVIPNLIAEIRHNRKAEETERAEMELQQCSAT